METFWSRQGVQICLRSHAAQQWGRNHFACNDTKTRFSILFCISYFNPESPRRGVHVAHPGLFLICSGTQWNILGKNGLSWNFQFGLWRFNGQTLVVGLPTSYGENTESPVQDFKDFAIKTFQNLICSNPFLIIICYFQFNILFLSSSNIPSSKFKTESV